MLRCRKYSQNWKKAIRIWYLFLAFESLSKVKDNLRMPDITRSNICQLNFVSSHSLSIPDIRTRKENWDREYACGLNPLGKALNASPGALNVVFDFYINFQWKNKRSTNAICVRYNLLRTETNFDDSYRIGFFAFAWLCTCTMQCVCSYISTKYISTCYHRNENTKLDKGRVKYVEYTNKLCFDNFEFFIFYFSSFAFLICDGNGNAYVCCLAITIVKLVGMT